MKNSKIEEYWKSFTSENNIEHKKYEAWQFGFDADLLGNLVRDGIKTATASAHIFYEIEQEELPKVGGYNIILDSQDNPLCITKTTKVCLIPFNQVSSEHAYKEGEGDRSLEYWRKVHQTFFTNELKTINLNFQEDMEVVCEEFEMVYK
ncbi:ASCH domain-containing protein [Streptococcus didelphis]|uniref:ASCH domain-containing protein n=1 Tax=Streptococcus didelphis TaxID=102886 RepID=A0ABY9LF21_9STRE|nr:ASCH domain-containing protein [Streptococcus didelphis]WMB27563.1 ASCH domain-containing protein [Streptococcus didelphis]WMB29456.1 ASCH domain-containing protein [Streptococcus didelphis]